MNIIDGLTHLSGRNPVVVRGNIIGIKSSANPSAQTTSLCKLDSELLPDTDEINGKLEALKSISYSLYAVAYLQLIGGLRISETLNISPLDITSMGLVLIKSSKGGQSKLINSGVVSPYLLNCKKSCVYPFSGMSRFFCYRQYKMVGLSYKFKGRYKASVTHFFRHYSMIDSMKIGVDNKTRSRHLGHKNLNSTKHYEHGED